MGAEESQAIARVTARLENLSGSERAEALCELGNLHEANDDLKAASRAYSEAFVADPQSGQALANAKRVYIALQLWPQALRVMEAEASIAADPMAQAQGFDECAKFAQNFIKDSAVVERLQAKAQDARAAATSPAAPEEPAPFAPPPTDDVQLVVPEGASADGVSTSSAEAEARANATVVNPLSEPTAGFAEQLRSVAKKEKVRRIALAVGGVLALVVLVKVGLMIRVVVKCGVGHELVTEPSPAQNGIKGGTAERCLANGVDEGTRITRDDSGQVVGKEEWKGGVRAGPAEYVREDTTIERGLYAGGHRQGLWRTVDAAGQIIREVPYLDDVVEGTITDFGPDGKKVRDSTWVQNKAHGFAHEYDAQGNVRLERYFVEGKEVPNPNAKGSPEQFAAGAGSSWVVCKAKGDEQLYGGRPIGWWNERVRSLRNRRGEDFKQAFSVMIRRAKLNGLGWDEAQAQFSEPTP